jgi:tetratricopeptide (TPR) repeat protein
MPTRDSPLAAALIGQGRIAEGEALLLPAYETLASGDTVREPYGSECFGYMISLYATTNRPEQARGLASPLLRLALERCTDAYLLRRLACHVVVHPGLPDELYELASKVAMAADRLDPNSQYIQWVLPAAYYRMGRFETALEELEHLLRPDDKTPMYCAFLAMTYKRIGHTLKAQEALQYGRTYLKNHGDIVTGQERALLAEAAKLIDAP